MYEVYKKWSGVGRGWKTYQEQKKNIKAGNDSKKIKFKIEFSFNSRIEWCDFLGQVTQKNQSQEAKNKLTSDED